MKTKILLISVVAMLTIGLNEVYGQWSVYECDVLPENIDPPWAKLQSSGLSTGDTAVITFVDDDPDIAGNKYLRVEDLTANDDGKNETKECWGPILNITDPNIGTTLVVRVRPSAGILAKANGDDGQDYEFMYVSIRNGTYTDILQWVYPNTLKLKKSVVEIDGPSLDWHIFRFTLKNDQVAIYLDEDPTPVLTGTTTDANEDNQIRFGDNDRKDFHGGNYDWFVYDTSGAYAPGEGTALPASLTGYTPTSVLNIKETGENLNVYPNPFTRSTKIGYEITKSSMTRIDVYDVTGKLVSNLLNEVQLPGKHEVVFNAESLNKGVYFCRMRSGGSVTMKKMILQ